MKTVRYEIGFEEAMYDLFGPEWDSGRIGEAIVNSLARFSHTRDSAAAAPNRTPPRSILTIRVKNILLIVSVTELEHVYSIDHA